MLHHMAYTLESIFYNKDIGCKRWNLKKYYYENGWETSFMHPFNNCLLSICKIKGKGDSRKVVNLVQIRKKCLEKRSLTNVFVLQNKEFF